MKRRRVIQAIAAGGLSAGCLGLGRTRERTIEVTVRNDSSNPVILDVFFTTAERETLSSVRYELQAETADESHTFQGKPEIVYVVVDEETPIVTDFEGNQCDRSQSTVVGIVYESDSGVEIGYGCHG